MYTSKIENVLARKKVFIVLDDVGSLYQLDSLLGNPCLHLGSKIIITTKDASLTERCAIFNPLVHPKHTKVFTKGLCETNSLELLCIHAFKCIDPKEVYKDVSKKLVQYCEGHPLALEVLGKSLHNRDVAYWEEYLQGLQKETDSRITKVLQMSFDSLPTKNDKELFKHIACFFVGKDRDFTETILDACAIKTRSGITNLIDRCLLGIGRNNELLMHQLVQDMGRDLVHQESPYKPWKRSRLWCHEESFKVLKQNKGKGNLLGLALDMRMLEKKKLHGSYQLKPDSFSKMDNLMLLQLNYVQVNVFYVNFLEELRWVCMHGFPLKSLSLNLPMENLVALDMSYSNIESFDMSKDKRLLGSLKILNLSFCEQLHSLGGFWELLALERLIVRNCISVIDVCESIEQCVELVLIDFSYCYKLKKVPISIGKLKKVKTLLLDGCNSCEHQIESCDTSSSDISINAKTSLCAFTEAIPRDMEFFVNSLPSSLRILSLANNNLSKESFPMDFSFLSMLKELCLDNNPIVSMPSCVRSLPRLEILSMNNCDKVISIEHPPRLLRVLLIDYDVSFKCGYKPSLRKVKFDREMSPLRIKGYWKLLSQSSFEIEGIVKIQAIAGVEEKVLHGLGWTNLEFITELRLRTYKSQTQVPLTK